MDELWALPAPDDAFGSFVVDAFRASGLDYPRATVITSRLEMRANLLRTGRYLSIIPEFWLQLPDRHPFLKKLPVELPIASAPIGIVTLKNRKPSPVVQLFIDCAREVAKPMAKGKPRIARKTCDDPSRDRKLTTVMHRNFGIATGLLALCLSGLTAFAKGEREFLSGSTKACPGCSLERAA